MMREKPGPVMALPCPAAAAVMALLACLALSVAQAGEYPARPIRFVVANSPGGGLDITARTVSPGLITALGQQVIIDNRPGAAGSLAAEITARSAPDGYTVLMGSIGNLAVNVSLYKGLGYHPLKDLAPTAVPQVKAGKIKALAVTTARRSAILPELPTIAESGLPGFDADNWYGIVVAAKTPRAIIDRLNAEWAGS